MNADELARGEFLKVFDQHDGVVFCDPADEPRLDAAVTAYVDSGGTRDVLIGLTLLEGVEYKVLASTISAWFVSTPESRSLRTAIDKASQEEHTEFRRALGDWGDED